MCYVVVAVIINMFGCTWDISMLYLPFWEIHFDFNSIWSVLSPSLLGSRCCQQYYWCLLSMTVKRANWEPSKRIERANPNWERQTSETVWRANAVLVVAAHTSSTVLNLNRMFFSFPPPSYLALIVELCILFVVGNFLICTHSPYISKTITMK